MRVRNSLRVQTFFVLVQALSLSQSLGVTVGAETLKGGVEVQEEILRLERAKALNGAAQSEAPLQGNLRLQRPGLSLGQAKPLIDTSAFNAPLQGAADQGAFKLNAQQQGMSLGLVKPGDFPSPMQAQAERNSREMMVAWDTWHHNFSSSIYNYWNPRNNMKGMVEIEFTVTKDNRLSARVVDANASPQYVGLVMDSINHFNGNPYVLTFPKGSLRNSITFKLTFQSGPRVKGGYYWQRGDYEKYRIDN